MSSRTVVFHSEAVAEAKAAVQWYRERNITIADAFLSEMDSAVERISETPERWPLYVHRTRRFLFRRFPFFIVYREKSETIEVIAVTHFRRKPGYWKNRSQPVS
ncbi:MAG: type II toxin-antitoxin system RelE/ParE family toxin [Candidatus Latescibacter sp.]|nr:type II toxin-antitoxin system RelE/ParE family toxin [Candidatus Latescibacter sp.]